MSLWRRCWKLSLILIVAIGPTLSVHLPWASGVLFAASALPKSHPLPEANPISYIISNTFIHLAADRHLSSRPKPVIITAIAASESALEGATPGPAASAADGSAAAVQSAKQPEIYVAGKAIQLLPTGPTEVSLLSNGQIRFVATLVNERNSFWHITVTGMVQLADGTRVTVLEPRSLWMVPGQKLRLPVALNADPERFPPGWTQFRALLRDDQGRIIDQASINFLLTFDLAGPRL